MKSPQSYEAYCTSCRVSHPPGTRRCVHCGGTVTRERPADVGGLHQNSPQELPDLFETEPEGLGGLEPDDATLPKKKPPGGLRVVLSLLWIAVAVGISVYRGCQGGG